LCGAYKPYKANKANEPYKPHTAYTPYKPNTPNDHHRTSPRGEKPQEKERGRNRRHR
jgi:hypothetical protein